MLIQTDSFFTVVSISWAAILAIVLCTVLFFGFALGMGIKAQRRKPTTGAQGIVGEVGTVIQDLQPDGQVKVHGEIWNASSLEGTLEKGTLVRVERVENLTLKVRKVNS